METTNKEFKLKEDLSFFIEEDREKFLFIRLVGAINSQNSYIFQNEILKILGERLFVIFDCKDLTYLTSSGIGAFLFIKNKLKKNNGGVFIINPQPKVVAILGSMGVTDMVEDYKKILKIIENTNVS